MKFLSKLFGKSEAPPEPVAETPPAEEVQAEATPPHDEVVEAPAPAEVNRFEESAVPDEAPVEEALVEESLAEEALVEESLAEEAPVDEAPAEETVAEPVDLAEPIAEPIAETVAEPVAVVEPAAEPVVVEPTAEAGAMAEPVAVDDATREFLEQARGFRDEGRNRAAVPCYQAYLRVVMDADVFEELAEVYSSIDDSYMASSARQIAQSIRSKGG